MYDLRAMIATIDAYQRLTTTSMATWLDATGATLEVMAGTPTPWSEGLRASARSFEAVSQPAATRSWYRAPAPAVLSSTSGLFSPTTAAWTDGGWADPWRWMSRAAFGMAEATAYSAQRDDWYAAWMEGASRAFLPEHIAGMIGLMRRPEVRIPYVSYRSDGGHAVSQIAYSTTRLALVSIPALALMPSVGSA